MTDAQGALPEFNRHHGNREVRTSILQRQTRTACVERKFSILEAKLLGCSSRGALGQSEGFRERHRRR